jgi:AraC-like DNA-binding protein
MGSKSRWENKLILDPACEEIFIDNRLQAGLMEFDIQLGGVSNLSKRYLVRRHRCQYHTIIYTRQGQGLLKTASENKPIPTDSLLLLPAGSSFSYQLENTNNNWQIAWYLIDDTSNWQWLKNRGISLNTNNNVDNIYYLSLAMYQETFASRASSSLLSLNAQLLVGHIKRDLQATENSSSRKQQKIQTFFHQLECKLQQPWNLPALARLAGYSPAQFNRLCVQQLATTPVKKLRQLRMQRAKALLKSSKLNLSDIANAVGYNDVFNFSSAFKREVGIAPNLYRNS